jgi:hypothetical protein
MCDSSGTSSSDTRGTVENRLLLIFGLCFISGCIHEAARVPSPLHNQSPLHDSRLVEPEKKEKLSRPRQVQVDLLARRFEDLGLWRVQGDLLECCFEASGPGRVQVDLLAFCSEVADSEARVSTQLHLGRDSRQNRQAQGTLTSTFSNRTLPHSSVSCCPVSLSLSFILCPPRVSIVSKLCTY